MVVKEYSDDDKIVVYVEHHGKYQWDMINGNNIVSNTCFYSHALSHHACMQYSF
jgi:hypothetical protein